jgi:hypothetical protein
MIDLDLTIARDGKNSQIFQLFAAQRHQECMNVIDQVLSDSGGAAACVASASFHGTFLL